MLRVRGVIVCLCVLAGLHGVDGVHADIPIVQPLVKFEWMEEEVRFEGAAGFELVGTLTLPLGDAPEGGWAGMVLLPGSGPTDRDGNQPPMFMTDLLKTTAQALGESGVAVLRFDKRACRVYAERYVELTAEELAGVLAWEHFVGDAVAAVEFLRGQAGVDRERVGILGHSEGGLIAMCAAHELEGADAEVAGLVLAGTSGRRFDVLMREQLARQVSKDEEGRAFLDEFMRAAAVVRETGSAPEDLPEHLRMLFPKNAMGVLPAYFTLEPLELARAYAGPVLLINGERDVQVLAETDFVLLRGALEGRADGKLKAVVVEDASHNFKRVESEQDLGLFGPVVEEFVGGVVEWVKREVGGTR